MGGLGGSRRRTPTAGGASARRPPRGRWRMSSRYTSPDFTAAGLITIDTQRDVLDGGLLEIAGTSTALEPMRDLVRAFRAAGRPIVHIVRIYRSDGSNVDLCRRELVEHGA